jgi:hypothetical protein
MIEAIDYSKVICNSVYEYGACFETNPSRSSNPSNAIPIGELVFIRFLINNDSGYNSSGNGSGGSGSSSGSGSGSGSDSGYYSSSSEQAPSDSIKNNKTPERYFRKSNIR